MPFSMQVKLEAKSAANYTCCWCRVPGQPLHVHHIDQEADGGSDQIENAAPMCPNCHYSYGHNPEYRTEVRQRRGDWNARCAAMFAGVNPQVREELDQVQARLAQLEENSALTVAHVGTALSEYARLLPNSLTTEADRSTSGAVLNATANLAATYSSQMSDFVAIRRPVRFHAWTTDDDGERRLHVRNEGDDVYEFNLRIPPGANLMLGEGQLPLKTLRSGATASFYVAWASNGARHFEISIAGRSGEGPFGVEETVQLP